MIQELGKVRVHMKEDKSKYDKFRVIPYRQDKLPSEWTPSVRKKKKIDNDKKLGIKELTDN